MIEATELRIGNYLDPAEQEYKGKYFRIDAGDIKHIRDGSKQYRYNPIPITEDILIKAGFEKLAGTKSVYVISPDDELEISVNTDLKFAYIDTPWGQASIKRPIYLYLHQLQNLYYSLTGQELEIKI